MKAMLQMKVDMLTTDQPLEARKLMKEMNIKELKCQTIKTLPFIRTQRKIVSRNYPKLSHPFDSPVF